jgi:hypothetical protein
MNYTKSLSIQENHNKLATKIVFNEEDDSNLEQSKSVISPDEE